MGDLTSALNVEPRYECDCGATYSSLSGLDACAAGNHGKGWPADPSIATLTAERDALRQALGEAREALVPFALMADNRQWSPPKDVLIKRLAAGWYHGQDQHVSFADVIRAAAALARIDGVLAPKRDTTLSEALDELRQMLPETWREAETVAEPPAELVETVVGILGAQHHDDLDEALRATANEILTALAAALREDAGAVEAMRLGIAPGSAADSFVEQDAEAARDALCDYMTTGRVG